MMKMVDGEGNIQVSTHLSSMRVFSSLMAHDSSSLRLHRKWRRLNLLAAGFLTPCRGITVLTPHKQLALRLIPTSTSLIRSSRTGKHSLRGRTAIGRAPRRSRSLPLSSSADIKRRIRMGILIRRSRCTTKLG